jgi:hypothetical protein
VTLFRSFPAQFPSHDRVSPSGCKRGTAVGFVGLFLRHIRARSVAHIRVNFTNCPAILTPDGQRHFVDALYSKSGF